MTNATVPTEVVSQLESQLAAKTHYLLIADESAYTEINALALGTTIGGTRDLYVEVDFSNPANGIHFEKLYVLTLHKDGIMPGGMQMLVDAICGAGKTTVGDRDIIYLSRKDDPKAVLAFAVTLDNKCGQVFQEGAS